MSGEDNIIVVHRPGKTRELSTQSNDAVTKNGVGTDEGFYRNMKIADVLVKVSGKRIKKLSDFQSIWVGHLNFIDIGKPWIKQCTTDKNSLPLDPDQQVERKRS